MTYRRLGLAATFAAGALSGAFGVTAFAAEPAFVSPLGITVDAPGAMQASEAYAALNRARTTHQGLGTTGSAVERKQAADAVMRALRAYEASVPGAKRDAAALVAALKKANRLATLDQDFYARPAAFLATPGEVAAVRAAGGPAAVLSNAARYYDQDLAELKLQLGQGRSAWRVNFSPIPKAHAGFGCSLVAFTGKMSCIGYKPCYNWWASVNNDYCL